jgi:hypothetical protein
MRPTGYPSLFGIVAEAHVVPYSSRIFVPTHTMTEPPWEQQALQDEIADLEKRLHDAKARLNQDSVTATCSSPANDAGPLSRHSRPRSD